MSAPAFAGASPHGRKRWQRYKRGHSSSLNVASLACFSENSLSHQTTHTVSGHASPDQHIRTERHGPAQGHHAALYSVISRQMSSVSVEHLGEDKSALQPEMAGLSACAG